MKIYSLIILLFLTACGRKKAKDEIHVPANKKIYISMNAKALKIRRGAFLPSHLKVIHNDLAKHGKVLQTKAMQAQVIEESKLYEQRTGQSLNKEGVYKNLLKVASLVPSKMNFDNIKNAYLSVFQSLNKKEIEINASNRTLVDPLLEGRMNNLSGSKVFDFMLRAKSLNANKNMVMIFQNGHVTPGFLIPALVNKTNRNQPIRSTWNLIGIESTSRGMGFLHFGDPDKFTGNLQVIDADEFLMVELFKPYLRSPSNAVRRGLRRTCRKYNLNCSRFPAFNNMSFVPSTVSGSFFYSFSFHTSVHSVFAFGQSSTFRSTSTRQMSKFSHKVVTGARYINNRYVVRGVAP